MEFTQVMARSPERLVNELNAIARKIDVKTISAMMWQPHGAIVIVGFEPKPAPKKRTRRNLVKELEVVKGGAGEPSETDVYADIPADSGGTKAD